MSDIQHKILKMNVTKILQAKGLNLGDLSYDKGFLSKILNGKVTLTEKILGQLAYDLGVPVEELTDEEEFKRQDEILKGNHHLYNLYDEAGQKLMRSNSADVTELLKEDGLASIIYSVLCGGNVREVTEFITRNRLIISNAALTKLFADMKVDETVGESNYLRFLGNMLLHSSNSNERLLVLWMLGLTQKGLDNIVRGQDNLNDYVNKLNHTFEETTEILREQFGELEGEITIAGSKIKLNWEVMNLFLMAVGSQTLTIRGSSKSMSGKLFERLVLGAALTLMGFEYVGKEPDSAHKESKIFWLSSSYDDDRETDATVVYNGQAISVDIGFIGKGNPEIMLDKVTRFRNKKEYGGLEHTITTVVLVDTIGDTSRLPTMVAEIGGCILEMKNTSWLQKFAVFLNKTLGCTCYFESINESSLHDEIKMQLDRIDLSSFIK